MQCPQFFPECTSDKGKVLEVMPRPLPRNSFFIILTTLYMNLSRNTYRLAEKNQENNMGLPVFYTAGLHKSKSDKGHIAAKKRGVDDKGRRRGVLLYNFPIK